MYVRMYLEASEGHKKDISCESETNQDGMLAKTPPVNIIIQELRRKYGKKFSSL